MLLSLLLILFILNELVISNDCRIRFVVVVISGRGIKLPLGRNVMIRAASVPCREHSLKSLRPLAPPTFMNVQLQLWILATYYELADNFESLINRALLLNVLVVI